MAGWIGVDFDGTLAVYGEWRGPDHIGEPIPLMVERIRDWRSRSVEVRIFTARVAFDEDGSVRKTIEDWCLMHIGEVLTVTCQKDYGMVELWDDRCVRVIANTGQRCCDRP